MKRRAFLRVLGRAGYAAGPLALLYPYVKDVVEPILEGELLGPATPDFAVDVRLMGLTEPVTDWFPVRNSTPELFIEQLEPCTITAIEARIDLGPQLTGQPLMHTMRLPADELPVRMWKGDTMTINFNVKGLVDLSQPDFH